MIDAHFFASYGTQLLAAGEPAKALPKLEVAHALLPTDLDVAKTFATALIQLNRHKDAARVLDVALRLAPDDIGSLCVRGELALSSLDHPTALHCFERCVHLDPKGAHPHGARARVSIRKLQRTLELSVATPPR
jgi:tetratricopeptide (TPR) repeat protein